MYIQLSKKNILTYGILLGILFLYKFMNLPIMIEYRSEMVLVGNSIMLALPLLLYKDIIEIGKRYTFLKMFLIYVAFSQIIICIYSMYIYHQTLFDMFVCMGSYFILLLSMLLIIGMEKYGTFSFLRPFYIFSVLYMNLLIANAFLANSTGLYLLASRLAAKNERVRTEAGSLFVVVMLIIFWIILVGYAEFKHYVVFILGIFLEIYVEQTRIYELALFFAFLFMWICNRANTESKFKKIVLLFLAAILFYVLGLHQEIIESFSLDPTINPSYASSLARINAIDYFSGYLKANPLIGMGWVRPKNDTLALIFAGPNQTAFFDDLGFLGQIFRQGILGGVIYVIFIVRLFFVINKLPSNSKYKNLVIGILVYILVSAISLNCFDGQRILGTAFLIAIVERIFKLETEDNIGPVKRRIVNIGKEI